MAHFAKISLNNKVLSVHTVEDELILNADNQVDESVGQQYLELHNNWPRELWIQTSYHTKANKHYNDDGSLSSDQSKAFRGNYAGIGFTWDEDNEIFWPKKPHASWVKNISTAQWQSPLGLAPSLTDEQQNQNDNLTHAWMYFWEEDDYLNDNTTGWVLRNNKLS